MSSLSNPEFSYILSFIISGGYSSDFIKMRMLIKFGMYMYYV